MILAAAALPALAQPAVPPAACKINVESVPVKFGGEQMYPVVAATINKVPTLAVIDLSSPDTTLNKATLDKIGVRASATSKVRGVGGSRTEYVAKVDEITVGQAKAKGNFLAYEALRPEYGIHVGANYLLRSDLELAFAEKAIRYVTSKNCENENMAYWGDVATSVPFLFHNEQDLRPEFKIKVDGKELTAMFSTTIEHSVISVQAASRLPGKSEATFSGQGSSRVLGLGKTSMPMWIGEFGLIEIGGEQIKHSKLNVMSLAGIDADVILGMDYLRSHRILIAVDQRRIYFTYTGGPLFNTGSDNMAWLLAEAGTGNADALYRLGLNAERGSGHDLSAQALAWYRQAAALDHHGARERLAGFEFERGNFGASAQGFREVFRQRPPGASSAAKWYAAAARAGGREAALAELKALRAGMPDTYAWGGRLLDLHLDNISQEKLFKHAADDEQQSSLRLCEANYQAGQYHLIAGRKDAARALFETARDQCPATLEERYLAAVELARLDSVAK